MKKWTMDLDKKYYEIVDGDGVPIGKLLGRAAAIRLVKEQNSLVDKIKELEAIISSTNQTQN